MECVGKTLLIGGSLAILLSLCLNVASVAGPAWITASHASANVDIHLGLWFMCLEQSVAGANCVVYNEYMLEQTGVYGKLNTARGGLVVAVLLGFVTMVLGFVNLCNMSCKARNFQSTYIASSVMAILAGIACFIGAGSFPMDVLKSFAAKGLRTGGLELGGGWSYQAGVAAGVFYLIGGIAIIPGGILTKRAFPNSAQGAKV